MMKKLQSKIITYRIIANIFNAARKKDIISDSNLKELMEVSAEMCGLSPLSIFKEDKNEILKRNSKEQNISK